MEKWDVKKYGKVHQHQFCIKWYMMQTRVIRFLVGSQTCYTIMKHTFPSDIRIRMAFSPSKNLYIYIYVELKLHKAKTTNQYKANVLELLYLFTTAIRAHPKSLVLLMHKCYKILQQAGSGTMFPGCKQGFTVLLDMYLWWNIQDFRFGLQSVARSWTWYLEVLLYIMRGLWIISMTQNPKQSFRVCSKFAFAPLSNFS